MGILKATLWTVGAMVAVGAILERATRAPGHRLVQTTLDDGVTAWQ